MISAQLLTILNDHFARNGLAEMQHAANAACARLSCQGLDAFFIASIPSPRDVMLFAKTNRPFGGESADRASPSPLAWRVLEVERSEAGNLGGSETHGTWAVLSDDASGAMALSASAAIETLDAPTFDQWIHQFAALWARFAKTEPTAQQHAIDSSQVVPFDTPTWMRG